ncbi:MAG: exonuclease domain-containing protein [Methanolobus sp.]|nr:exonuclease domain-containing protein [Methanolobus sp.]
MFKDLKTYAKVYWEMGFNVNCCSKILNENNFRSSDFLKSPSHKHKHYFTKRQDIIDLDSFDWENAYAVGVNTGFNGLCCIDIDFCWDYKVITDILELLYLPADYEWVVKTGSQFGYHIYFFNSVYNEFSQKEYKLLVNTSFINPPFVKSYLSNPENRSRFHILELLLMSNSILPPSLHRSGLAYEFVNCSFPSKMPLQLKYSRSIESLIEKYTTGYFSFSSRSGHKEIESEYRIESKQDKDYIRLRTGETNIPEIDFFDWDKKISKDKSNLNDFFLFVDIETDGLIEGDKYPAILEIAWLIVENVKNNPDGGDYVIVRKKQEFIINLELVNNNAYSINNIDINFSNKVGKPIKDVLKDLIKDINNVNHIVAHNIEFDLSVIKYYLNKNNLNYNLESKNQICTMIGGAFFLDKNKRYIISRQFNINRKPISKYPKNEELYNLLYNKTIQGQHSAIIDVIITFLNFNKISSIIIEYYNKGTPKDRYLGNYYNSYNNYNYYLWQEDRITYNDVEDEYLKLNPL